MKQLKIISTLITLLIIMLLTSIHADTINKLDGPYINPDYLTKLAFGLHSHWIQPWRAYQETVPAHKFLNSIGVNFDMLMENGDNPDLLAQMLAKNGVKHARVEIGWGSLNYKDESINGDRARKLLQACKKHHIRPLILLNSHHGVPCPIEFYKRILASPAQKGDVKVELTDTTGIIPGYSGFCNLTDYWACEVIITRLEGNTAHLSKPLPVDLGDSGKDVLMGTLKYRPFSEPGSDDYKKTIEGWKRYVAEVTRFTIEILGTGKSIDKGFDIEVWNELTFGSNYLSINNYYDPDPSSYRTEAIWSDLVKVTSDYIAAHPLQYRGVTVCDGFANTIPWPASSTEPARVTAISRHPYPPEKTYPKDEYKGEALNALMERDKSGFIPSYTIIFPEYYATALQTETVIRDMAPITTDIYNTLHGKNARVTGGKVNPCPMWFTEVGTAPNEIGITDKDAALKLKAKTTARYYCFFANKGIEKLYLYAACAGDMWLGLIKDDFVKYARTNDTYPANDKDYTSPALQVLARITKVMEDDLDPKLQSTRDLHIDWISDTHGHSQFTGDGTIEHPDLKDRDVFAFLPYQVNDKRFVVPYYVMTRDIRKELAPEEFTIQVSGVKGNKAKVSVYDPINNQKVPAKVNIRGANRLSITLTATDYPYLLIIDE
ncbi:MAG: hypothetical protein ACYC27_07950 [Armatimonadota bacterium]